MAIAALLDNASIRQARADAPKMRDRDFADQHGLTEAGLLDAYTGEHGVTRIVATPEELLPLIPELGEVMALTRNDSCVHEKVGTYSEYKSSPHAGLILNPDIDMRIFQRFWVHAFAVEKQLEDGAIRRSLQVFDASGTAVHKIFLRDETKVPAFNAIVEKLRLEDQTTPLAFAEPAPVEDAIIDPTQVGELRRRWEAMTDTHQFLRLVKGVGMNRLGAYRAAGKPFARLLQRDAFNDMLEKVVAQNLNIMIFVGNAGNIQIHTGEIHNIKPMGPWQNIIDPGFNLHLRLDKIAELWAVSKPTLRGPAVSIEAFDSRGELILQIFGTQKPELDHRPQWDALVETLAEVEVEMA